MAYKIYDGLYYARTDEWVKVEGNTATVGITDYAQDKLGDIVYIEEVKKGKEVKQKDTLTTIESVKAASDIYAPVSGKVIQVNTEAVKDPSLVNKDPYGKGWLVKLEGTFANEVKDLMTAKEYAEYRKE